MEGKNIKKKSAVNAKSVKFCLKRGAVSKYNMLDRKNCGCCKCKGCCPFISGGGGKKQRGCRCEYSEWVESKNYY